MWEAGGKFEFNIENECKINTGNAGEKYFLVEFGKGGISLRSRL